MNDDSVAFLGDGLRVQGDLGFCGGFRSKGEMRLIGAVIGGDLVCAKAEFSNPDKIAFMADRARIGGAAIFGEGFTATGETRLVGAAVNRDLIFAGAQLSNPGGKALNAEHLDVGGSLRLRNGFLAEGEVSLLRSVISKSLDCSGGRFQKDAGNAISADGIVVHDVYFALGFEAHGPVRILGAKVSGDVACIEGTFNDPDGIALGADCAQIEGSLFLRDATMHGEIRLLGARIGANLECDSADLVGPKGMALNAQDAEIGGNALFRKGFHATGTVCLYGASVRRHLVWQDVRNSPDTSLDLRGAFVGVLADDAASWPSEGNLRLSGFRFKELSGMAPATARERIRWLRLQPRAGLQMDSYEWVVRLLRESGRERDADKVLMAKNDDRRTSAHVPFYSRFYLLFWKLFTGYGYRPLRPLMWALLLVAISGGLFSSAEREGLFTVTETHSQMSATENAPQPAAPDFRPLLYALDSFVPYIDMGQVQHWSPNLGASGQLASRIRITGVFIYDWRLALVICDWLLVAAFAAHAVGTIGRRF